jgi:hypothetical protein
MALLAPPPRPPQIALSDDDGLRKFRLRMTQALATIFTILVTGWLCTLGVVPAIIALSVAKHVLVAIFLMGIGVDAPAKENWQK